AHGPAAARRHWVGVDRRFCWSTAATTATGTTARTAHGGRWCSTRRSRSTDASRSEGSRWAVTVLSSSARATVASAPSACSRPPCGPARARPLRELSTTRRTTHATTSSGYGRRIRSGSTSVRAIRSATPPSPTHGAPACTRTSGRVDTTSRSGTPTCRRTYASSLVPAPDPFPKIELHVHLEGTVRPATLREIARRNDYPLPDDLEARAEF